MSLHFTPSSNAKFQWSNPKSNQNTQPPSIQNYSNLILSVVNHTTNWNCSSCNTFNQSPRNTNPCNNCGARDSNINRIKANAFYQFGIINLPQTRLLPSDTPFFIYPLCKPKISYYTKPANNGITIRFIVHLTNTNQTTNYNVSQIRFAIKNTSNNKYKGLKKVIQKPSKPGTFDTFFEKPYYGKYELDIQALIQYKMGAKNGYNKYNKSSPTTQLNMTLGKKVYTHERLLQNFIVSQSDFFSHQFKNMDDEKYHEPKLTELPVNNDDYQLVYYQFLESSQMQKEKISDIFIYKIYNKCRVDGYNSKKQQIRKSLNNKSMLNELPLYHGTDIDTVIKILHQGFLRQFSQKCVFGKGSYFARDASYSCSPSYASLDRDEFQHILLCNVICGEWCKGSSSMRIPPCKPNKQYLPYDTTVDNTNHPSVFVTYQDDQALPTYLISFKTK